jgi:hypothetical protein
LQKLHQKALLSKSSLKQSAAAPHPFKNPEILHLTHKKSARVTIWCTSPVLFSASRSVSTEATTYLLGYCKLMLIGMLGVSSFCYSETETQSAKTSIEDAKSKRGRE